MSSKWIAIKTESSDASEFFEDFNSLDVEYVMTLVDEGNPTILVNSLEDLPKDFIYELI